MKKTIATVFLLLAFFCQSSFAAQHGHQHKQEIAKKSKKKNHRKEKRLLKKNRKNIYRTKGDVLVRFKTKNGKLKSKRLKKHVRKQKRMGDRNTLISFDETKLDLETAILDLKNNSDVEVVEPNLVIKSLSKKRDYRLNQRNLKQLRKFRKKRQKNKSLGKVLKIGLVDTGIDYLHPDLTENIKRGVNVMYTPSDLKRSIEEDDATEMDYNGHGTAMAGIIAASHNGFGIDGVTKNASVYGIKAFDREGEGYLSDIVEAIEWSIENDMDVISMSFGTYESSEILKEVIQKAHRKGILLVAAAGNDYAGDIMYPAKYKKVMSVGSHDEEGWISRFSNWDEKIDFFVPGKGILATGLSKANNENPYDVVSGTSASAAYVTGVIALLAKQGESKNKIKKVLNRNSFQIVHAKDPSRKGYNKLNIEGLLKNIEGKKFQELTMQKVKMDRASFLKGEVAVVNYTVLNSGNVTSKQQNLFVHLKTRLGFLKKRVGSLKSLEPKEKWKGRVEVSIENLLSENMLNVNKASLIHFSFSLEDGVVMNNSLHNFSFLPKEIEKVTTKFLWLDNGMALKDSLENGSIKVLVENTGTVVQKNLKYQVFWTPSLHENPKPTYKELTQRVTVPKLKPGQSKEIVLPLKNKVDYLGRATLLGMALKDDKMFSRYFDEILVKTKGKASVLFTESVHTHHASDAIELLKISGVSVPDFEDMDLIGTRGVFKFWPFVYALNGDRAPDFFIEVKEGSYTITDYRGVNETRDCSSSAVACLTSQGYWNDAILDEIKALEGYGDRSFSFVDGSADADGFDAVFPYNNDLDTWDSHFWVVDEGDDIDYDKKQTGMNGLHKIAGLMHGANAINKPSRNKLMYGAIEHYKAGHKQAAWWLLGHAIHHMGDLSLPSHVNSINSHGVNGSAYHDWLDINFNKWSAHTAKNQGEFVDPYKEEVNGDPIRFLAYTTAQIANSFAHSWTCVTRAESIYIWPCDNDDESKGLTTGNFQFDNGNVSYSSFLTSLTQIHPGRPMDIDDLAKSEVFEENTFSDDDCEMMDPSSGDVIKDCDGDGHADRENISTEGNADKRGNDSDGDLTRIGDMSYNYSIRAAAGLIYYFLVETGQVGNVNIVPTILTPLLLN